MIGYYVISASPSAELSSILTIHRSFTSHSQVIHSSLTCQKIQLIARRVTDVCLNTTYTTLSNKKLKRDMIMNQKFGDQLSVWTSI